MGRPKGYSKTGGRTAGTPNRLNNAQAEKLQSLCDKYKIDPLESLLKICADETIDLSLRVSVLKEITQYIYPKRKSIEIAADLEISSTPQIQIYLPDNGTSRN